MAERIEVIININNYPEDWSMSPAMWECWLVGKLKDAGVPVEGKLVFRGVKQGTLTRLEDQTDFGVIKYIWEL